MAIFLLTVYTGTTFGISVNFHYCGNYLSQISILNFSGNSGCSCNPESMPKDCCKDKTLCSKADKHNTLQESYTFSPISTVSDLPPVHTLNNWGLWDAGNDADNFYPYVRRSSPQPIYLLIMVFRI